MANVPWLNITPGLQLQARQAGTAAGLNRAQMAQQAAIESARMEAAANELNARLRGDAARLAMQTAAQAQMANTEAELARDTLRQRSAESALDRALRSRQIDADIMGQSASTELRRGELDRGRAADAFRQELQGSEQAMNRLVQEDANKAIAEIQAGAPPMGVLQKYPNASADQRIRNYMQFLNQSGGPVTPSGANPFRNTSPVPLAPTNAPSPFIIRGVK